MKSKEKRRTNSLRINSDKLIGGQIGHIGYFWEAVDVPDEIIEQYSAYCKECGAVLSVVDKKFEYGIQEINIPVTRPIIKDHRYYVKVCKCGCHNRFFEPIKKGGSRIIFGMSA